MTCLSPAPVDLLPLRSARLEIAPWRREDAPVLVRLGNDRDLARMMVSIPHPFTEADAVERIARAGTSGFRAAIRHAGVPVGEAGILAGQGDAELMYWIGAPHRRQGFAREAAEALVALAFGPLDLPALTAECYDDNAASLGLLDRLGFRIVGEGTDTTHPLRPEGARHVTLRLTRAERETLK